MEKLNPDFDLLTTASSYVRRSFEESNPAWADSPFNWVLSLSSGSKGKLGKLLVRQWCALKELDVNNSPDSEADFLLNGHRVEIKFSTLWKNGIYKFQQIRDQNYEYAIFLGISPKEAHCWVIEKKILREYVIGHLGQHTGAGGKDTAWVSVNPQKQPKWLESCGGSLEDSYLLLRKISRVRK